MSNTTIINFYKIIFMLISYCEIILGNVNFFSTPRVPFLIFFQFEYRYVPTRKITIFIRF